VSFAAVMALRILRLDHAVTTLLAGAGIIGLVVGIALKDLSANFIAGVGLVMRRPVRVGDLVQTQGFAGLVQAVEWRATVIHSLDGRTVFVPNRKIYEEPLINFTTRGARRVELECSVSYDDDLDES